MKLRISARRSDLARLQAYSVGARLAAEHKSLEVEYLFKESLGDQNQNDPLWKMPAQGVFTEDFVNDLREGKTDLVVHSWKDLPTAPRPGLLLAATLPRADSRDLFFLRKEARGKKQLTLLTSSPRRTFSSEAHLASLLPFPIESLTTKPVRGNVLTRLKKLAAGEGDGLFMAKAALDRLLTAKEAEFAEPQREIRALLSGFHWMVLPLSLFPTAPAQGALAIEIAHHREDLKKLLAPIHDAATAANVNQERQEFSAFGGGCHQKIGISVVAHARLGKIRFFHGQPDGREPVRSLSFEKDFSVDKGPRWPSEMASLFQRERINASNPGGALFVSRQHALPEEWHTEGQILWAAGVQTWRKLASSGHWVCGSSDGLGESKPEIDALLGESPSWTKLTHADSRNDGLFSCLATYRLIPGAAEAPPLVDSYFWASESLFRWAISQRPEIRSRQHASGPGYTASAIEKELGHTIHVYYNYNHWKTGNPLE